MLLWSFAYRLLPLMLRYFRPKPSMQIDNLIPAQPPDDATRHAEVRIRQADACLTF